MPITYGLTSTGFVPKTPEIIQAEVIADIQAMPGAGASVDVSSGSFLGQLIGILSEREGALWDLAQAVNASLDPDASSDANLDGVCALTGTFREQPTPSNVTLTLTGTPGTVVSSTAQVATASTGSLFQPTVAATIGALTAWAGTTAYNFGDRRTNAGNAYQCTIAGTSAGSGGPTTLLSAITDGTVTWTYLGAGTGATDVVALSVLDGPIVGASRDITVIRTPVGGWSSAINLLDAELGAAEQTDESLRTMRDAELSQAGVADPNAIRAAILLVPGVTSCKVFYNNTDVATGTASAGNVLPPHSIEALVQGGADQDVLNTLFGVVCGGIAFAANGTIVSGTVTDSEGVAQPVQFSRPAQVNIYVDITYVKDPTAYPSDGDTEVKNAIVAYGQAQLAGKDVVASGVASSLFPVYVNGVLVAGVAGILDVTPTFIGLSPSPASSATLFISDHQMAAFDTSRITVHTSNGTP
jgi:uncharacterized phage protein gp47/JayE